MRKFFDFLAKMGLSIRDDPPKTIELKGRDWGAEVNGFALSLAPEPEVVSVILRNTSPQIRNLTVTDYSRWFHLEVAAPLTPFGREQLRRERIVPTKTLSLAPGAAIEAQIPISSIFQLNSGVEYAIQASCTPENGLSVVSNPILYVR